MRQRWPLYTVITLSGLILFVLFQLSVQTYRDMFGNEFISFQQRLSVRVQALNSISPPAIPVPTKPAPIEAKGIYLTAYSAASATKRQQMIDLITSTELNTVVIDIKDYSGYVLYDTDVSLANDLGLETARLGDVAAIVEQFHDAGIYVIARQTVFQDPVLAEMRPDLAFQSSYGGLWRDNKGLAWVDATNEEIWEYNVAIAKEAIGLGFDEINFDYVRFPTDGNMAALVYSHEGVEKYDIMREFYTYLSDNLADEPAYISLDFFGFVMERHDGMTIGQRLEDAVDVVDYISPMMYPSHYPAGHLGLANPAANPGIVISHGMEVGSPYFENTRAQARPWIQAFDIGAVYDGAKIRAQIDAVEAYTDGGWLLWNASNRYSSAGLRGAE